MWCVFLSPVRRVTNEAEKSGLHVRPPHWSWLKERAESSKITIEEEHVCESREHHGQAASSEKACSEQTRQAPRPPDRD